MLHSFFGDSPKGLSSHSCTFIFTKIFRIKSAQTEDISAVNSAMVFAYWEIGKRIVEEEQNGSEKADYGAFLLKN